MFVPGGIFFSPMTHDSSFYAKIHNENSLKAVVRPDERTDPPFNVNTYIDSRKLDERDLARVSDAIAQLTSILGRFR